MPIFTSRSIKIVILCAAFIVLAFNANAQQNRQIILSQPDTRFTVTAESHFSTTGGWEQYYFTVKNNTSQEYRLVINVSMELACVGSQFFNLGVNGTVHLPPNGVFRPSQDHVHSATSPDSKNFKDCRLSDNAGGFTLVKSVGYHISDVQNLTEIAANKAKVSAQPAITTNQNTQQKSTDRVANASPSNNVAGSNLNTGTNSSTVTAVQPQPIVKTDAQRQAEIARNLAEIERQRNEKDAQVQNMTNAVTQAGTMFGDAIRADAEARAAREERQERTDQLNRQKGSLIYQQYIAQAETGDETAIAKVIYAQTLMGYGTEDFATRMVNKFNSRVAYNELTTHFKNVMNQYKMESQSHVRKAIGTLVLTGALTYGLVYLADESIKTDGVNSSDAETYTYVAGGVAIVGTLISIAQFSKIGYKYKSGYVEAEGKLRRLEATGKLAFSPVYNWRSNAVCLALKLNF